MVCSDTIVRTATFHLFLQVEEDRVLLFLSKKQDKSWYPELESGLETAEEEEEEVEGQS